MNGCMNKYVWQHCAEFIYLLRMNAPEITPTNLESVQSDITCKLFSFTWIYMRRWESDSHGRAKQGTPGSPGTRWLLAHVSLQKSDVCGGSRLNSCLMLPERPGSLTTLDDRSWQAGMEHPNLRAEAPYSLCQRLHVRWQPGSLGHVITPNESSIWGIIGKHRDNPGSLFTICGYFAFDLF